MSEFNPVAWSEGMFLKPQHFQQQERFMQYQHAYINRQTSPFCWGMFDYQIDSNFLTLGQLSVEYFQCVFQDNTLVLAPLQHDLPKPLLVDSSVKNKLVYLCIPVNKSKGLNVSSQDDQIITRYEYVDQDVFDITQGLDASETLQVEKIKTYLKLQDEDRSGYLSFAIAQIIDVTAEGVIHLNNKFIAPSINIVKNNNILKYINEISGMINQRAEVIANRLTKGQGPSSSVADFLMLQLLNRFEPIIKHYQVKLGLHPISLYETLISFAGELSTFSSVNKRTPEMPKYQHENLTEVFQEIVFIVNQSLSSVIEQTALQLPIKETQYGIHVSPLNDKQLLDRAEFILAVKADVENEYIRTRLPSQIKIGSVETIRELVNNQLAGISMTSLPVAPRQVAYHAGYHYFQLDKSHPHWSKLKKSGGIALHFSGNYPDLRLQLWAINN